MTRFLIIVAIAIFILIVVAPYLDRLGLGRGRGKTVIERPKGMFYALIVTCVALSLILSTLVWWFGR